MLEERIAARRAVFARYWKAPGDIPGPRSMPESIAIVYVFYRKVRANLSNCVEMPKLPIAVVIPCFRVKRKILAVLQRIGPEVSNVYVIDDGCPEKTGLHVQSKCGDARVKVIYHAENLGVGGATLTGYQEAIKGGAGVIVKIDGDGQMDPGLIRTFVRPILEGRADYTKGNRFFYLDQIACMPGVRVFGNAVLSFMAKLSTGYWSLFDPTNGFIAIHASIARRLPFGKIKKGFMFETDMLFRLNTMKAKVIDIPMSATYKDENSNLKIISIIFPFLIMHCTNFVKRIFYNYFLRDISIASIELVVGLVFVVFGLGYGLYNWAYALGMNIATPAGTVMLSALPIILGLQLLLNFISYDIYSQPKNVIHVEMDEKQNHISI